MTVPLSRLLSVFFLFLACCFATVARAAEDPVPASQAYIVTGEALGPNEIALHFTVRPGYYLYADKFAASTSTPDITLGTLDIPKGEIHDDPNFGVVETFPQDVTLRLPITARPQQALEAELAVSLQGCWSGGICFPPETRPLTISLPVADSTTSAMPTATADNAAPQSVRAPVQSETGRIQNLLQASSLPLLLASFFGFGLLLALTPCMFPMIPILSGIIAGQGNTVSRRRAGVLSLAYVLGMAITYAIAGVLAGLSGTMLAAALQHTAVLTAFALLFVVLSGAMFGFYELQLPAALQSRLAARSQRLGGGQLGGVFLMGILSALIVGPCVAAPLAGALLYIAQSRDAVRGGLALFTMALGMGAPLIAVGLLTRSLLPKSGAWMENVRRAFGFMLLALAVWIALPVTPDWFPMLAWGLILVFAAIHLHALEPLPTPTSGWARTGKALALVLLLYGVTLLVGLTAGSRDPLQPLAFLHSSGSSAVSASHAAPAFTRVRTVAELEAQLQQHRDRPVLLDYYADWCVTCRELERFTFPDPQVVQALQDFVLLQVDVTANNADDQALLKRYNLFGPPAMLFFRNGEEIAHLRQQGFVSASDFLNILSAAHPQ